MKNVTWTRSRTSSRRQFPTKYTDSIRGKIKCVGEQLYNNNCSLKKKTALSVLYFKREPSQNYLISSLVSHLISHRDGGIMFSTFMIISTLSPPNRLLIAITFDDETKCSELNSTAFRNKCSSFALQC